MIKFIDDNTIEKEGLKTLSEDIGDRIKEKGLGWFTESIGKLDLDVQKVAYGYLLYRFTIETRMVGWKKEFVGSELTEFADVVHNLPLYLARDLEGFCHWWFWMKVRDEKLLSSLQIMFINRVAGYIANGC